MTNLDRFHSSKDGAIDHEAEFSKLGLNNWMSIIIHFPPKFRNFPNFEVWL